MTDPKNLIHWADQMADRIIRTYGDKEIYTLASGITPSGVVHFGNFRETMTVDLVSRALKDRQKKVRFIFSWDDYDTFRKVPINMPKQELLKEYLFQPIVDTPDPFETCESYARFHEKAYEDQLHRVDIFPEPIYQAKKYRAGDYREGIKKALMMKEEIAQILNEHRKEPLPKTWLPISIYCDQCNTDKMESVSWDGKDQINYKCTKHGHTGNLDLTSTERVKLPWRIDWPMRWQFEQVDFEPGGKDHSSQGGSYTTAKEIVSAVYGFRPPLYLQYEFVSIKGRGGKMSSSKGDVVTLSEVLNIYEPEIIRYIFASYRSNVEFAVSFDLDVLKTYEDFDRMERQAFGLEPGNEKKVQMSKRVYELSIVGEMPKIIPFQPAFRHLCNVLQIFNEDISKAKETYKDEIKNPRDERRFNERAHCALYWLKNYAPEEFKFKINEVVQKFNLDENQKIFLTNLKNFLEKNWGELKQDKDLHEKMYEFFNELKAKNETLSPGDFFTTLYQILISQEKGPKLAGFILIIGKEKVLGLLNKALGY